MEADGAEKRKWDFWTHDPGEGEDAEGDLGNVPALEEVGRLEDLLVRDAVFPYRRLEPRGGQWGFGLGLGLGINTWFYI